MTPRAPALPPDDRRAALVAATIPLLREHGRGVTTRQIAQAAGVAEGTIFRVFDSKDALVDAALADALDPDEFHAGLRALPGQESLRETVVLIVSTVEQRLRSVIALMEAVGIMGPPPTSEDHARHHAEFFEIVCSLLQPHAAELRVEPVVVAHLLRLQTFMACHPATTGEIRMDPQAITDIVLYGVAAGSPATAAPQLVRATAHRPRKAR
ncbi:MAG: TetR/AcrR family transcriptional regulator [Micrococcales bacterium]|nr:TetR/AcrR family transcriptional regulator [Micrococcales bacterium]